MGGWWILGLYVAGWLLYLIFPVLRHRLVLVGGDRVPSLHLLLMAALLADAAVFPVGLPVLPAPLTVAGSLLGLSLLLRNTWVLAGIGGEHAMELLVECCRRSGIPVVREDGGRLVLKRHGAALSRRRLLPGLDLVRLDRRRKEPELDRLGVEWRRAVARWREAGR